MKKYIVKNKVTGQLIGEYDTKKEAHSALIKHIVDSDKLIRFDKDDEFINVFDYKIVEEFRDINSYEEAKEYLGLGGDTIELISIADVRYRKSCVAYSRLLTIADAWNKQDGFNPDFSDKIGSKYSPCFKYDKDAERFVCIGINFEYSSPYWSCRFFFKNRQRALEFGKKFEDLFNDLFG